MSTDIIKVKKIDQYILESVIGSGQYGSVYAGYHQITKAPVAIKTINRELLTDSKMLELLENEIKVLKRFDNSNIVKLYDLKKTKNNIYLILEYCNQGTLSDYLKNSQLTENQLIKVFLQILNAFKTLHAEKIMHRDLKLENIQIHNGEVKLADFGFSKNQGDSAMAFTLLGSPLNMAPEIIEGRPYNSKADIWSLGVCFYQLLFKDYPYTAKTITQLIYKINHLKLDIDNLDTSEICKDVQKKMLVVDPDIRVGWEELFNHAINGPVKGLIESLSTLDKSASDSIEENKILA